MPSQTVEESTPTLRITETVPSVESTTSMKVQFSTLRSTPTMRAESTSMLRMATSAKVQQFSSYAIMPTKSQDVLPMTSSPTPCDTNAKTVRMDLKFQGKLNVVCNKKNQAFSFSKLTYLIYILYMDFS